MLAEALRRPELRGLERATVAGALESPLCWPAGAVLASEAQRHGLVAPEPRVGEVPLVSVSEGRVCLWRALLAPDAPGHARELVGTAAEAAARAWRLVSRDLPVLRTLDPIAAPPRWLAAPVAKVGGGVAERVLDGPSFGLALCLAGASCLLDTAAPADLLALGEVMPDGRVGAVGALDRKLEVVAGWALGLRRLLVASEQVAEAGDLLAGPRPEVEVVGVARLQHALDRAFPDALDRALGGWQEDPGRARAAARALFRQAVDGELPLIGWGAVARAASLVAEALGEDDEASEQARFAAAVASRHEGGHDDLPWPPDESLDRLPRPLRLQVLAHVVQAGADCRPEQAGGRARRALARVAPPPDRHREDLQLLGAAGRALIVAGDPEGAAEVLLRALDGWQALLRMHEASYALSEYLRLLGVLGRREALARALEERLPAFLSDAHADGLSRAFVALGAGRALAQTGSPVAALRWLSDEGAPWELAPGHACAARRRWQAHALGALGRAEEAAAARADLDHFGEGLGYDDPNPLLARIDEAEERGGDPAPPLRALLERDHPEARRIVGDGPADADAARRLAREYRY